MVKKLKKIALGKIPQQTDEILFMVRLAYVAAMWMGITSTAVVSAVILFQQPLTLSVFLNGVMTLALLMCGIIGFISNVRQKIFSEFMIIIPVIVGLLSVVFLYVLENINTILARGDLTPMAGLSGAFISFFIYYLILRYRFIYTWIEEGKKNRAALEKIESLET